MDEDWVAVRNCNWLHEAHFVKSVLEAGGIEVLIPDAYTLGVLHAATIGGVRVLVRSTDLQRAAAILDSVTESSGDTEHPPDDEAV